MNRHLAFLALLLFMVPSLRAESGELPATLSVEGKGPLTLASQAARRDLLGAVELYTIALYTDRGAVSRDILASSDVAKALRFQVRYEEDLRRRLALDCRRELLPRLEPAAAAHIQGSFAPIQNGDTVIVEYVPGRGTTVRVNKGVAVSGANHDLMLAFLDLGRTAAAVRGDQAVAPRPVSDVVPFTLFTAALPVKQVYLCR